jgi:hypothetical protein
MTEIGQGQTNLEVWVQALAVGAVGYQQRGRWPVKWQPLPVDHRQRHLQRDQAGQSLGFRALHTWVLPCARSCHGSRRSVSEWLEPYRCTVIVHVSCCADSLMCR